MTLNVVKCGNYGNDSEWPHNCTSTNIFVNRRTLNITSFFSFTDLKISLASVYSGNLPTMYGCFDSNPRCVFQSGHVARISVAALIIFK